MSAQTATPTATPARLMFEATVTPHRSLGRRGILTVMGFMLAASLFVTSLMALLGAWVVVGFNGADLALALFLFWLNVRAARAREFIRLDEHQLEIIRVDLHGKTERAVLPPYWLNVVLEERAGTVPKLRLATRGVSQEVARQLGEAEKRDLAAALTRALHQWRNPVFDNPQLRS